MNLMFWTKVAIIVRNITLDLNISVLVLEAVDDHESEFLFYFSEIINMILCIVF